MPTRILALLAALGCSACAWFRPAPPEYGTTRLESGLIVHDLVVPDAGAEVASGDTVALSYDMRLADQSLVESSRDSGQPLRFEVGAGSVPRGLEEGVLGMRLFGRRRLTVPPALGFGAAGRAPLIPPEATLIFEIELMEHVPQP